MGHLYERLVFVWWIPALVLGQTTATASSLSGEWQGTWKSTKFYLELEEDRNALLTGISMQLFGDSNYEPTFSKGSYHSKEGEESSFSVELSRNRNAFTLSGEAKDPDTLEVSFDGEQTVLFNRLQAEEFDWQLWGTYYYLNPRPSKFPVAANRMHDEGVLEQPRHVIADLRMLMAATLGRNPDQVTAWMSLIDRSTHKEFWDDVLYYSNTIAGTDILLKEGRGKGSRWERFIKKGAPVPYEINPESADTVDLNWGYFFATGDTRSIRNIIGALKYAEYLPAVEAWQSSKKSKSDARRFNLGAAFQSAIWSVQSNCTQHRKVLEYCDQLLTSGKLHKDERIHLQAILQSREVNQARNHYAMLQQNEN